MVSINLLISNLNDTLINLRRFKHSNVVSTTSMFLSIQIIGDN